MLFCRLRWLDWEAGVRRSKQWSLEDSKRKFKARCPSAPPALSATGWSWHTEAWTKTDRPHCAWSFTKTHIRPRIYACWDFDTNVLSRYKSSYGNYVKPEVMILHSEQYFEIMSIVVRVSERSDTVPQPLLPFSDILGFMWEATLFEHVRLWIIGSPCTGPRTGRRSWKNHSN